MIHWKATTSHLGFELYFQIKNEDIRSPKNHFFCSLHVLLISSGLLVSSSALPLFFLLSVPCAVCSCIALVFFSCSLLHPYLLLIFSFKPSYVLVSFVLVSSLSPLLSSVLPMSNILLISSSKPVYFVLFAMYPCPGVELGTCSCIWILSPAASALLQHPHCCPTSSMLVHSLLSTIIQHSTLPSHHSSNSVSQLLL